MKVGDRETQRVYGSGKALTPRFPVVMREVSDEFPVKQAIRYVTVGAQVWRKSKPSETLIVIAVDRTDGTIGVMRSGDKLPSVGNIKSHPLTDFMFWVPEDGHTYGQIYAEAEASR